MLLLKLPEVEVIRWMSPSGRGMSARCILYWRTEGGNGVFGKMDVGNMGFACLTLVHQHGSSE